MASKTVNQRFHAKRRASERFGLSLNRHQYRDLVRLIQGGKAEFIGRESLRLSHWLVTWEEKQMHVVYDSSRHTVVTLMLPGSIFHSNGMAAPAWYRDMQSAARRAARLKGE